MPLTDPIGLLEREDKWYLGNGGQLVYAPPFPQHLRVPGFWDECQFGDVSLNRLLCVSIAAEMKSRDDSMGQAAVPASESTEEPYPGYIEGVTGDTLTVLKGYAAQTFMAQLRDGRRVPIVTNESGDDTPVNIDTLPSITVVDLSSVSFYDSSGLGYLVVLLKKLKVAGKELVLCGANPQVSNLLSTLGIDKYTRVFSD